MKLAPNYLSHSKTNDAIDTISRALGRIKRIWKAIISSVMPDGCVLQFTKPEKETQCLEDYTRFILSLDNDDDKKLITDMREFNYRGNTYHSKYDLFW